MTEFSMLWYLVGLATGIGASIAFAFLEAWIDGDSAKDAVLAENNRLSRLLEESRRDNEGHKATIDALKTQLEIVRSERDILRVDHKQLLDRIRRANQVLNPSTEIKSPYLYGTPFSPLKPWIFGPT